ncbi:hypothetical protein LIA77_04609 [Sarocladium implicatum]|nr:hypothetical protein LIA77_04609 [Sarocladium implicatum]
MSPPLNAPLFRAAARTRVLPRNASSLGQLSRGFSGTSSNYGRVLFGEASTPELRQTLDEIQEKYIIPAHLPPEQLRRLRNVKKKTYLQQNPIVIEIEGVQQRYDTPVAPHDRPNSKALFKKAFRLMHTKEDLENLQPLLSGFKKARVVLKSGHFGMATRAALSKDGMSTLVDCARHAEDTGFLLTLDESGFNILEKIARSAGVGENESAVKWLEQVMDILERSPHTKVPAERDIRTSKLARGLMLATRVADIEASQSPSKRQLEALDDEAQLARALWKKALADPKKPLSLEIDELNLNGLSPDSSRQERGLMPLFLVRTLGHNVKALAAAPSILGEACEPLPEASKRLDEYLTKAITTAAEQSETVRNSLSFYARAYKEVVGRAPTWAEPMTDETYAADSEKVKEAKSAKREARRAAKASTA